MPARPRPWPPVRRSSRHDGLDRSPPSPRPRSTAILARHILADGFDLVVRLREEPRRRGSTTPAPGATILDFCTFFASNPIGYNHPKMKDPEFLKVLHRVAQLKPALSDLYSVEYAWFVGRLRAPGDARPPAATPSSSRAGRSASRTRSRPPSTGRCAGTGRRASPGDKGQQVLHFRQAFHGRSGYALSLTNTDPVKTDFFPKFPWPRVDEPGAALPGDAGGRAGRRWPPSSSRSTRSTRAFADNPDDIAAIIVEPIQAEGGDNHFRPEFLQALAGARPASTTRFFVLDEVQTGVGITGKMWAHEHFGLEPDAVAFGKKTQVCGCLVGPRVDEEPENVFKVSSRINSTWGGGLTDMVRCGALPRDHRGGRGSSRTRGSSGERLLDGLRALAAASWAA